MSPNLSNFLKTCFQNNENEKAYKEFVAVQQRGYIPTIQDYNVILNGSLNSEYFEPILREMFERNLKFNHETYAILIRHYMYRNNIDEAREIFDELKKKRMMHIDIINAMIEVYAKKGDVDIVKNIIQSEEGLVPNEETYFHLMNAFLATEEYDEAQQIYEKAISLGIEPSTQFLYDAIIRVHVLKKNFEEAISIFQEMKKRNLKPNPNTLSEFIKVYLPKEGLDKTMSFVYEFDLNPKILSIMIKYTKENFRIRHSRLLFHVLNRAKYRNVDVPEEGYLNAFYYLANYTKDLSIIEGYFHEMMKRNPKRRKYYLDLMMYKYCSKKMMDKAKEIFEQIENPDIYSYHILMDGYAKSGDTRQVVEIFKKLREPNHVTFGILSTALIVNNCGPEEIQSLMDEMRSIGVQVHDTMYNRLIQQYLKVEDLQSALNVLEEMRKAKMKPSRETYLRLIKEFHIIKDYPTVVKLFNMQKEDGIVPKRLVYRLVLFAYFSLNDVEAAEEIIDTLSAKGLGYYDYLEIIYGYLRVRNLKKVESYFKKIKFKKSDLYYFRYLRYLELKGEYDQIRKIVKEIQMDDSFSKSPSFLEYIERLVQRIDKAK